ncbi:PAS domain S-box protein [Belnapia sp. T6]|uniref:histidine kinase n=1 Tax=Belnapia mucosa TaxID=2804532 RepID=A0ABS1V6P2_9PROT|nr:PAS domain-containing protein [Belnapia mucosa]MBL6457349.1 PAS domain S-box protein [Belnapia mucosa]
MAEPGAEALYEDAPCGYLSWQGTDGPILQANGAFRRWTGYDTAELVGLRRFEELLTPAARIMHATRHLQLLLTRGVAERLALELVCADGNRLPVLVSSAVRRDAGGAPVSTQMMLLDATAYQLNERRLMEARERAERSELEARRALAGVEAANRGKARFLSAMNHEFRTPIGVITGFADLLVSQAERPGAGGLRTDWLREISAASFHLLGLLEDATCFARLDEAPRQFAPRPSGLRKVADAGLHRASPVLDRAQLAGALEDGEEVPAALDEALAAEAVAGILRELGRRAPPGQVVRLRCLDTPARIELRCAAVTLSAEAVAGLQAPLDAAVVTNRGLEGAGLGIAVAERIATIHGGSLRIGGGTEGTLVTLLLGAG